jgi:hypothetical protein
MITGRLARILFVILVGLAASPASAYTANQVRFEFRPDGLFRVHVAYTIPELKELRESYAEFTSRKAAEAFYWALLKGADFYHPDPKALKFKNQPQEFQPW